MQSILLQLTNAFTRHRLKTLGIGAGVVVVLGVIGFSQAGDSPFDSAYNSLALFAVSFPDSIDQVSIPLQIARFLAPVVTVAAAIAALMEVLNNEIDAFRSRRLGRHTLICGAGDRGVAFALDYFHRASGNVSVIEADESSVGVGVLRAEGIPVVIGDAREPRELRRAGAANAQRIICVTADDEVNAAIVTALTSVKSKDGHTREVYCHIGSSALHRHLTASSIGKFGSLNVQWFNVDSLAAEALVSRHFDSVRRSRAKEMPRGIAVLGESEMSEAVVAEAARQWLALKSPDLQRPLDSGSRLDLALVSPNASSWIDELRLLHRDIDRALNVKPFDSQPMLFRLDPSEMDACFVALRNPIENLETAFHLKAQSSGYSNIVVRVLVDAQELTHSLGIKPDSVLAAASDGLDQADPETLGIKLVNVVQETCTADQVEDSLIMRLARENHQVYRKRYGGSNLPAANDDWDTLDEGYRRDNIRCARHHLETKLPEVQMTIAPLASLAEEQVVTKFSHEQEQHLCKMEHERWVNSKLDDGWEFGPERDDDNKQHPDLLDWEDLPEKAREKDLLLVQALPAMLRALGFGIYRPDNSSGGMPAEPLETGSGVGASQR